MGKIREKGAIIFLFAVFFAGTALGELTDLDVKRGIKLTRPVMGIAAAERFWRDCSSSRQTGAQWTFATVLWSQVEPESEYREFIQKLTEHLKGKVTKYAIENEAHSTWRGTFEEYQKLLKTAHDAITEVKFGGNSCRTC